MTSNGPGAPGPDVPRARRPVTLAAFLARGLLAGLLAGLAAFAVAYVVAEPTLSAAIAYEDAGPAHSHDGNAPSEPAGSAEHAGPGGTVVPRAWQSTLGLATGTVVAGVSLGGLLGVLTALALGRLGRTGPRAAALALAAAGLVAAQLVPFAVYPPNPPGVGDAGTLALRTGLYAILLAISLLAAVAAFLAGRALQPRWGGWHAGLAAAAGYLVVVGVAAGLLPGYDEVPTGYPAGLLYRFRVGGLLTQLALWAVLGVVLAELGGRLTGPEPEPGSRPALPTRRPSRSDV